MNENFEGMKLSCRTSHEFQIIKYLFCKYSEALVNIIEEVSKLLIIAHKAV